jgi:glucosamine-6-phosphate deaminase
MGNSPLGAYAELARMAQRKSLNMRQVRAFQLDEYLDIGPDDRRSLLLWLRRTVIAPCGVERVLPLPAHTRDLPAACDAFERAIEAQGGIDLQILGLGPNGHLGFNEPGSPFDSRTREVPLAPESVASNAGYWGGEDQVPRRSLTQGLATIMDSREVLLIVSGERKAAILARALQGPINPDVPASILQRHPALTVFADHAAARELRTPTSSHG